MYKIRVSTGFSAAHNLEGYPGDCCNLHGHNWKVTVTILCPELDELGMAVDFRKVKDMLKPIMAEFDHKHLNKLDCFAGKNPTSEELAKCIHNMLKPQCEELRCKLLETELWESDNSSVAYFEEREVIVNVSFEE